MVVIHSTDPLHAAEELEGIIENRAIAEQFDEIASLLTDQRASESKLKITNMRCHLPKRINRFPSMRSWRLTTNRCCVFQHVALVTLQAIIDATPAWKPAVASLAKLCPGGRLVINATAHRNGETRKLALAFSLGVTSMVLTVLCAHLC